MFLVRTTYNCLHFVFDGLLGPVDGVSGANEFDFPLVLTGSGLL
jgi:hypothetical protein